MPIRTQSAPTPLTASRYRPRSGPRSACRSPASAMPNRLAGAAGLARSIAAEDPAAVTHATTVATRQTHLTGAILRLSVDDARRRLRLLALIPEQLRAGGDAAAERRPLLAGDVLLAHRAARHLRRVGLAGRELRHRGHALAERCALLAGHVLLALVL